MIRVKQILIIFLTLHLLSCFSPRDKDKGFYRCFSQDWDMSIIPLIKPYFLSSTDRGESWIIGSDSLINYNTKDGGGIGKVIEFGISKNYFFGRDNNYWFLFDTNSGLFAYYNTKEELFNCMNSFKIPLTEIKTCAEYYEDCKTNGRCYWFPKHKEEYKDFLELKPKNIINLNVYNDSVNGVDFLVDSIIKFNSNHIYFFKIFSNINNVEMLSFGINWNSNILLKNKTIIPVFINSDSFSITLYTPFLEAKKRGISEEDRTYIQKQVTIEQN